VSLDDPEVVRREYASEEGLRTRSCVYEGLHERGAPEVAFAAVCEVAPLRVLEVGCGWGSFAERVARELGAEVVAVDLSERMVALAQERGVDARVGDVQELPFADGEFDCVVANWMLYHVPELDRGLGEIARVLRPGGRLVAATNGVHHLAELWSLVGRSKTDEPRFFAENGAELLRRHFERVERRDVAGPVVFPSADAVRGYIASSVAHKHLADRVPDFDGPLEATRVSAVFVAETAA
jgi:2-polyprenyl-3-methyl-5-hydroxy-6-metoxy-1,4-benzoquinol methylase